MIRPLSINTRILGVLTVAVLIGACTSGSHKTAKSAKALVVGSAPSSESVIGSPPSSEGVIVANMYAGALRADGYQVTLRTGLRTRRSSLAALQVGGKDNGIDVVPEYVGTLLEFLNTNAGEASGDLKATVAKLRARLDGLGLRALDPSLAADQVAFAVTQATADRYKLKTLSDLGPVAAQLTLGAGAECPTGPSCQPGLATTYNLTFKSFRVLDTCGPKTLDALDKGDIDVALVCSSEGAMAGRGLVVLQDNKKLQTVGNIVPVIRTDVVDSSIAKVLNKVSAALTTPELILLNNRADVDKVDPETLATEWLQRHGLAKTK